MHPSSPRGPAPPEVWSPAHRLAQAVVAPVERFLAVETASGLVLLAAAAVAMVLANSPAAAAYEALWSTPIGVQLGSAAFVRDLRWWINDGLMVVFFFVVGLEIRREIHGGELSELRRAALPLAAAVGGMVVPAAIYALLNAGTPAAAGWGVPMATDIAFAVGVLALLGDRVAPALRILLLSLAVIDDLGAILVIAFFYSDGIDPRGLAAAAAGLASIPLLQRFGVRTPLAYLPGALLAWGGAYAAGVHPTLAGVLVGLLTPVRAWGGADALVEAAEAVARDVRAAASRGDALHPHLGAIRHATREALSPVERLQHGLHTWVAFGVMPLFALANAGVALGAADVVGEWRVFLGVAAGLTLGKPVGVWLLARASAAAGLTRLPGGVGWGPVGVVGAVAGIGFTMALFIAQLAFPPGPLLETAKAAILSASLVSGVGGWVLGRLLLGPRPVDGAARTVAEAEASTDQ